MAVAKVLSVKMSLAMLLDISAMNEFFLPVITSVAGPNNIII